MNRFLIAPFVAAFILCALPASGLALDVGVSPQLGIIFAGAPDPAISGAALQSILAWSRGMLRVEVGLEAGESPLGWQVLAPLRVGSGFALPPFDFEVLIEAAPGAALFQQGPLFIAGLGAVVKAAWNMTPRFALFLAPGVRWTVCPAYQLADGSAYTSLDIPLTVGMRFSF